MDEGAGTDTGCAVGCKVKGTKPVNDDINLLIAINECAATSELKSMSFDRWASISDVFVHV